MENHFLRRYSLYQILCSCSFCVFLRSSAKYKSEHTSYNGLNEENLREECKREVVADKLNPVSKKCQNVKSRIVRIVKYRCNQAHSRTHDKHC